MVVFYILAPLPTMFTKSYNDRTGAGVNMDLAIFITMGFVVSSFALPIVLARAPVAHPVVRSCFLLEKVQKRNCIQHKNLTSFFQNFLKCSLIAFFFSKSKSHVIFDVS